MEPDVWRTEGLDLGMAVYTADDVLVGTVKAVREHDFIVDRDSQRDIIVAITMVTEIDDERNRLTLELTNAEADEHDWEHPPLI
jgi:hypothetical protein